MRISGRRLEDLKHFNKFCLFTSAPLQRREDAVKRLRFLEDEGFYVGVRPLVSSHNEKRMECRLLNELEQVCILRTNASICQCLKNITTVYCILKRIG